MSTRSRRAHQSFLPVIRPKKFLALSTTVSSKSSSGGMMIRSAGRYHSSGLVLSLTDGKEGSQVQPGCSVYRRTVSYGTRTLALLIS